MSERRGIPTRYNGVNFRSRIEARYADFFTRMGWSWTYEPFDLDGYLPDFVLEFYKPLIVEVKYDDAELAVAQSKIECSGWKGEALVVSGSWPSTALGWGSDTMPAFGSLAERDQHPDGGKAFAWGDAIIFQCGTCFRTSFCHHDMTFRCRVNGCYDGDGHLGPCEKVNPRAEWIAAGNRVQWRAA